MTVLAPFQKKKKKQIFVDKAFDGDIHRRGASMPSLSPNPKFCLISWLFLFGLLNKTCFFLYLQPLPKKSNLCVGACYVMSFIMLNLSFQNRKTELVYCFILMMCQTGRGNEL